MTTHDNKESVLYVHGMTSRKPQQSTSVRTTAAVVSAAAFGLLASPAGISPAKSSTPAASIASSASGTITINGTTTKVHYGYAKLVKGFFDPKKNDTEIILSDAP